MRLALADPGDASPVDRSPLGETIEEDVETESKSELETDDDHDDMSMLVVAPLTLSAGQTTHHLNEQRPGTVEVATHQLHAPRAPPTASV
jgi:hypothetical protein